MEEWIGGTLFSSLPAAEVPRRLPRLPLLIRQRLLPSKYCHKHLLQLLSSPGSQVAVTKLMGTKVLLATLAPLSIVEVGA